MTHLGCLNPEAGALERQARFFYRPEKNPSFAEKSKTNKQASKQKYKRGGDILSLKKQMTVLGNYKPQQYCQPTSLGLYQKMQGFKTFLF